MIIFYKESEEDRLAGAKAVNANKNQYGDLRLILALAIGFWLYAILQLFLFRESNAWIGFFITSIIVIAIIFKMANLGECLKGDETISIEIDTTNNHIKIGRDIYKIKRYIETNDFFLIVYGKCFVSISKSKLQKRQIQEIEQAREGKQ